MREAINICDIPSSGNELSINVLPSSTVSITIYKKPSKPLDVLEYLDNFYSPSDTHVVVVDFYPQNPPPREFVQPVVADNHIATVSRLFQNGTKWKMFYGDEFDTEQIYNVNAYVTTKKNI